MVDVATVLPTWLQVLRNPLPGESSGKHIGRIVRALIGLSLKNHADLLAQLFLVNESPKRAGPTSAITTNCGTSMREVWCLAGCPDHFVTQEYQGGMAVTWDLQAARDMGMLYGAHEVVYTVVRTTPQGDVLEEQLFPTLSAASKYVLDKTMVDARVEKHEAWELIDEGWGLHYATPGSNNDHMEFALARPDLKTGMCEHAGGGRADNAISKSTGDIRFSLGRPLQHVIAPYKMGTSGPVLVSPPPLPDPLPPPVPFPAPTPPTPIPASPLPVPATPPMNPIVHRTAGGALAAWVAAAYGHHTILFILAVVVTVGLVGLFIWEEIRLHQHKS